MKDLGALKRGSYDDDAAKLAWGVVDFIAHEHPKEFSGLLEDLRVYRDQHNRQDAGDGTWKRDREYELPTTVQEQLFAMHLGPDFRAEMTKYWRTARTGR